MNVASAMKTIVPAMPPPEGQESNFYGRTAIQQKFILTYSCTFSVAVLFLSLRLYTRGCITRKFGWDDREHAILGLCDIMLTWCGLHCSCYGINCRLLT
jgi:hypothetical protein